MHTKRFHPSAPLSLAAMLACACGAPTAPPAAPAAVMLGEWHYARPVTAHDPPSLNAGFFVTIAIDSAAAMRFWGRVTLWFAGDVGISPDRFGPVTGAIDQEKGVTLRIAAMSSDAAAHTVAGEIDGDNIFVRESWTGADAGPFPAGGRFQRLH